MMKQISAHILSEVEARSRARRIVSSTAFWYILVAGLSLIAFLVLNRLYDGFFFQEVFYGLLADAHLDFYVFLVGPSMDPLSYLDGKGINPPLVKMITGWISGSMPKDMYSFYSSSSLQDVQNIQDMRGNVYASLPFLLICALSLSFFAIAYFQKCDGCPEKKIALTFFALTSTGVIFALERGNFILVSAVCLFIFILYIDSENAFVREISLICYAVAAAIKVYPVIFGLILLFRREKPTVIFRAATYVVLLTLGPFILYGGVDAFWGFVAALSGNVSDGGGAMPGNLNGISLAATLFRLISSEDSFHAFLPLISVINYIVVLIIVCFSGFLKKYWEQVLALTLAMLFLPGVSATYTIIFLLPAFLLFLNSEKVISGNSVPVLIGFILLLVIFPVPNDGLAEFLRCDNDIPNRLSSIMLLNEAGEIVLFLFVLFQGAVSLLKKINYPKRGNHGAHNKKTNPN